MKKKKMFYFTGVLICIAFIVILASFGIVDLSKKPANLWTVIKSENWLRLGSQHICVDSSNKAVYLAMNVYGSEGTTAKIAKYRESVVLGGAGKAYPQFVWQRDLKYVFSERNLLFSGDTAIEISGIDVDKNSGSIYVVGAICGEQDARMFVLKMNGAGQAVWHVTESRGGVDKMDAVAAGTGSDLFVVGSFSTLQPYSYEMYWAQYLPNRNSPNWLSVDNLCHDNSGQTYEIKYGNNLIYASNRNLYLTRSGIESGASDPKKEVLLIMKINSENGHMIKTVVYPVSTTHVTAEGIAEDVDGSLWAIARPNTTDASSYGLLLKYNTDLRLLSAQRLNEIPSSIFGVPTGGVVWAGTTKAGYSTVNAPNWQINTKGVRPNGKDVVVDNVAANNNGEIYVIGHTRSADIWVSKFSARTPKQEEEMQRIRRL